MLFDPVIPLPWILLAALVVLGPTVVFYFRSGKRLGSVRNVFLLVLRVAALLVMLAILLQPYREEPVPVPVREKSVLFAIDTSASMAEAHADGKSRIDAARDDLAGAGVLDDESGRYRFFTLGEDAASISAEELQFKPADGKSTRIDTAVATILRNANHPPPSALVLLSDGHDFELIPPGDTARRTRARGIPVFTLPYGTAESGRDVSVRIANYHPHTFVRQKTQLQVFVRATGCPHETLNMDLLLDGKLVERKTLETGTQSYHNVSFTVSHEESGQFEYTFRLSPVTNERELSNNTATTYLNVIAEKIRILEIEGTPFWDTTFLRRSFARNDKFDIDSLVAFTGDRVRPIRSNPERVAAELVPPAKADDLAPYNLVVLGRDVQKVIGTDGIAAIDAWVKDHGGIVVFARGKAWPEGELPGAELPPIEWDTSNARGARLEVTPQAGSVPAFRLLREVAAADQFPEIISFPATGQPKTLATTFSVSEDQAPAVVYRRYGSGQTISLGVGNLWRWVFNPQAEYDNNAYDRFWDQLSLWLLANGGVTPIEGYSLRTDTANLPLGETIRLRFGIHGRDAMVAPPSISFSKDGAPVTNLVMTSEENGMLHRAEFTPRETGRYRAEVTAPDGKVLGASFIVFREDLESVETAMDRSYLDELSKASGGRLLDPAELGPLLSDLMREAAEQTPLTRRVSLWDRAWVFILVSFLLATDWYLRRRWGLI
ncbi:hypothetical protein OKA04_05255 [Luteolibacter flavescens]|uniref:Glutamine amidotransferase domain-containing protein n=1 Tax=Luteolibacter flavescens TaxID=1859460 RepID=A0ABT3FKN6_9BACT|nr:hypothetical protein [Luteolibacter flavescens]MCW1884127.1 hypothetical protein [Luteolibacter flavescens]